MAFHLSSNEVPAIILRVIHTLHCLRLHIAMPVPPMHNQPSQMQEECISSMCAWHIRPQVHAESEMRVVLCSREDTASLRQLAQRALKERDQEHMLRQQAERRSRHLQSDTEALGEMTSSLPTLCH